MNSSRWDWYCSVIQSFGEVFSVLSWRASPSAPSLTESDSVIDFQFSGAP
jgi:hypothetical protein